MSRTRAVPGSSYGRQPLRDSNPVACASNPICTPSRSPSAGGAQGPFNAANIRGTLAFDRHPIRVTPLGCMRVSRATIPSTEADGVMSGRRIIRKELRSPRRAAKSGTSRATCSARCRASVLMRTISSWISARLIGQQRLELGVAHDLCVFLECDCDPLLVRRGEHRALLSQERERERQHREHDAHRRSPARMTGRTTRRRSSRRRPR